MREAGNALLTAALLGHFADRGGDQPPARPELQLAQDGWQIYGGQFKEPLPISAAYAYSIAQKSDGQGQAVLDATRKHCGTLRLRAKSQRGETQTAAEEILDKLRSELEAARKLKAGYGEEVAA